MELSQLLTPSHRSSVSSALDGVAISIPMSLGGAFILYGQIAPEWLGLGVFAACVGLVLTHLLTANIQRPVVYAARFFEAATLAAMVQQLALDLPRLGPDNTAAVRVALACVITGCAGLVVGVLWLLRAERFVRFVPTPVYIGFTNSVAVALLISQSAALYRQAEQAANAWPVLLVTALVLGAAFVLRRWRPGLPASAIALAVGAVAAWGLQAAQHEFPMLMGTVAWTFPIQVADFDGLLQPTRLEPALWAGVVQHALVLGILMFLNTVVTGQMLTQLDDRQGMTLRDKGLQSLSMAVSGFAGASPISGAPNVAMAVSRTSPVNAPMLVAIASAIALIYLSQALVWLPLAALIGVFLFDAWCMWDRPTAKNLLRWLRRQPVALNAREDLLLIAAVMAASLLSNMVTGLFVGLILGLLLHANRNTRKPVRAVLNGRQIASNCARPSAELECLQAHGERIRVFLLDSNQYFVSAGQLNAAVRQNLAGAQTAILDWSGVRNIDTSLALVVSRLEAHATKQGVALLHAGAARHGGSVEAVLRQHLPGARLFPDLDRALERAENDLIKACVGENAPIKASRATLWPAGLTKKQRETLRQHMTWQQLEAGDVLMRVGDPSDQVWLIVDGVVSVELPSAHGTSHRVAGARVGALLGEVGFLDGAPRSATVVADTPLKVLSLGRNAFDQLARHEPAIVQRLLEHLALNLASRLRHANRHGRAFADAQTS